MSLCCHWCHRGYLAVTPVDRLGIELEQAGIEISFLIDIERRQLVVLGQPIDDFASAGATCQGLGGRLPTATEVFRVRANNGLVLSIGSASDTNFLWTSAVSNSADERLAIRVSDGTAQNSDIVNQNRAFRCVWPGSAGDVLSGRACYGLPAESCFQDGNLRIDRYDRAAVSHAAAAHECKQSGGRLPELDELQSLIHAGAPNGTNAFLWLTNPIANSNPLIAVARWSGTGANNWNWDVNNGSWASNTTAFGFRCVWSDRLD